MESQQQWSQTDPLGIKREIALNAGMNSVQESAIFKKGNFPVPILGIHICSINPKTQGVGGGYQCREKRKSENEEEKCRYI